MYIAVRRWFLLLLTLIIGAGGIFGSVHTTSAAEPSQASRDIICKGQEVPDGYAIVGHMYTLHCPSIDTSIPYGIIRKIGG